MNCIYKIDINIIISNNLQLTIIKGLYIVISHKVLIGEWDVFED
jgi:hypothetical protein